MQDLLVWMLFKNLPKEKKGPTVFLTLQQNIRKYVRHLSTADIGRAEVLKIITVNLD